MTIRTRCKAYYELTKPGIIRGNLISTLAGVLLASQGDIHARAAWGVMIGTMLIIGGSCALNNILDTDIDAHMQRTQQRALVTGLIRKQHALLFGLVLIAGGLYVLADYTNNLTACIGAVGALLYVIVYGVAKRKSWHGTLIGSLSGAIPPVAGYTAITGVIDAAAILLFAILVCWQMPHFYAISIYRMREYTAARIPVLPAVKGVKTTQQHMRIYAGGFIICSTALGLLGYAGVLYTVGVSVLGAWWLRGMIYDPPTNTWAPRVFRTSLIVMSGFSILIGVDSFLR